LDTRKSVRPPDAFIAKPIDQNEFLETVRSVLSKSD
jgi:hypothetical protein